VAVQNDAKVILTIQLIVRHARARIVRLVHHNLEAIIVVIAAVRRRASLRLHQRRATGRQDRRRLVLSRRRRGVALNVQLQGRRVPRQQDGM
jgi:hypothetical protein